MTEIANSQDRMRAVLVIVATIAMAAFNAFAAAGLVNGITPGVILDKYPTVLTPAPYVFSIWALIYLGLSAFSFYQFLTVNLLRFRPVRSLYILSCLLNCAWVYFWHRDEMAVCLALIFSLVAALLLMLTLFQRSGKIGGSFTRAPIGLYAGWATAAAIVNLAVFLKYEGVSLSPAGWTTIGVAAIALATALAVIVRVTLRNYLYAMAIAWALTMMAIKQGGHTAIIVAAVLGVVVCLVTAGSFVVDLRDSTSE